MLYLGMLISFFLEYLRPGAYLPIINALKMNSLVPLGVVVLTIFYKDGNDHKRFFAHPNTRWMLFFLLLLIVSVVTADVQRTAYDIFQGVLGYIFLFYVLSRLITSLDKLKGLMAVLVISHVLLLALNPALITNPEVRSYIYGHSFMGDGNDFALSTTIAVPMCLYLILESKKFVLKAVYTCSFLILVLGIIGTQSRGASLALVVVSLYLWGSGKRKVLGVLVIAVIGIGVLLYAPDIYFERLNTVSSFEQDGSAMGRIAAWKSAMRMLAAHPITGVGAGHFAIKLGTEFRPPEYGSQNLPWLTAHSMYFLVIGELGISGIVFMLVVLIGNFYRNRRLGKEALAHPEEDIKRYGRLFLMLNGSLVAFSVGGAFLSAAYYPHLYVLTGIFVAASFVFENALSSKDSRRGKTGWGEVDSTHRVGG